MHFYYFFLLLLVVLSAYSESPHHAKPPDFLDPIGVTVCPNSSSAQLGILAPVLPQNEVFRTTLPQNEVFRILLPQNEVFGFVLTPSGVFRTVLPQNEVLKFVLPHTEVNRTVLPQNGVFKFDCQLSDIVKTIIKFVLNLGGEKLAWMVTSSNYVEDFPEKIYTWSSSENRFSVQFKCRLIALMLKKSLFRRHDFAVCVHRVYYDYQNLCGWHWKQISNYKINSHSHIKEYVSEESSRFHFYGGGKALIFSSDELRTYALADLDEQQYQFQQCVKKDNKQNLHLNDGDALCSVPLNILSPKLTLKAAKELANLHDMYMPSKILLKNAQILLENHKCETCPDLLAVFKPYRVASGTERQKTWYQKNTEKRTSYEKHRYATSEYRESNKKSSQKYYWFKKDVKFPPVPPSSELCQKIISEFCAATSPDVFEETGCAVCGKLTPICGMEELSEVENISLLKADGVTRKARSKISDLVRELRGPILASGCDKVCPLCMESLDKKKVPTLALANGLWVGDIPNELQNLTYAEQLLIARVRHNRCIVRVSSGMFKMQANAISFSNPMPKIYNVLPPPIEEMDEVLAFIYTGPCKPTKADFQRTPLLVRRLKVSKALHWLKLNHIDYYDCEISDKNLASYPEEGPPVVVDYHPSSSNKNPESTSVHDMEK